MSALRVARFLRGYLRHPSAPLGEEETTVRTSAGEIPATLVRVGGRGPRPGWIVLHGITVTGRRHPSLARFTHALAATGATVLVPEVRDWTELRIDPHAADVVIAGSVEALRARSDVDGDRLRLVGFSFGATQALVSATSPGTRERVRVVVGFGGYCDLERSLLCMLTGEHEWRGMRHRLDPDPYGRWIVASNYLAAVDGALAAVGRAAHALAGEAGRRGAFAADALYDPLKASLRSGLTPRQREVWDLVAPPAGVRPPTDETRDLAARLTAAALSVHPQLEPREALARVDQRVVLAHGLDDQLIPYTETLRLREALGPRARVSVTITRLFAHSRSAERLGAAKFPLEALRYLRLLHRATRD